MILSANNRLLLCLFACWTAVSGALASDGLSKRVQELALDYFQTAFVVNPSQVSLKFLHPRQLQPTLPTFTDLAVVSKNPTPRLGYQTLWLQVYTESSLIDEIPITVNAALRIPVLFTTTNVRRGELLASNKMGFRDVVVTGHYNEVIRDAGSIEGMVAKQSIAKGEQVRRRMVRIPPDVSRGDEVSVQIKSGAGLTLTVPGAAKQDAFIGEEVKVTCQQSDRPLVGVVDSPGLVIVELK